MDSYIRSTHFEMILQVLIIQHYSSFGTNVPWALMHGPCIHYWEIMINILHVSIDLGLDIIMRFQLPQVLSFLDLHSIGVLHICTVEWSDAPLPSYFGDIKGMGWGDMVQMPLLLLQKLGWRNKYVGSLKGFVFCGKFHSLGKSERNLSHKDWELRWHIGHQIRHLSWFVQFGSEFSN